MSDVRVFADVEQLHQAAAAAIREAAARAIAERGRFLLVLAGGSTPRGVYGRLGSGPREDPDWERVHLFWGDERCVPPEHPESNFRMAHEALLRHVAVPPSNLHRIPGELAAEQAAARYEAELETFFGAVAPADPEGGHTFDLVLLGIGADGHTASLFPGSPALRATGWAAAAEAPPDAAVRERVTVTLPAINGSREVLFLATGADKRHVIARALTGAEPDAVPAGAVRPTGRLRWFLDAAAAGPSRLG
jgi:6-phosphogluconolactonase